MTVLLEPPQINDVNITVIGAHGFDVDVVPEKALQTLVPSSVGISWVVGEDKFLRRYGMYFTM